MHLAELTDDPAVRAPHALDGHIWVPIDDENCWAWSINFLPDRPLPEEELAAMRAGQGIHVKYIPGTFMPLANRSNDWLIDRQAQKDKKSFSGVEGFSIQDASLQESMGRIVDRTTERLGTSDAAIIAARRTLLARRRIAERRRPAPDRARTGSAIRALGLDPDPQGRAVRRRRRGSAARGARQTVR